MVFWALENADDLTVAMFGAMVMLCMVVMSIAALVDWIKNKRNGKS
jgi:hypothetical protein